MLPKDCSTLVLLVFLWNIVLLMDDLGGHCALRSHKFHCKVCVLCDLNGGKQKL